MLFGRALEPLYYASKPDIPDVWHLSHSFSLAWSVSGSRKNLTYSQTMTAPTDGYRG